MKAFGRLVRIASTMIPTITSGTLHRLASRSAESTIPALPATMIASAGTSISAGTRTRSPWARAWSGRCRSPNRPRSARYGTITTARRAIVTQAPRSFRINAAAISVTAIPTAPSIASAWRRIRIRPQRIALSPIIAAMLNTFEPSTTPTPTSCLPRTSAAIADETSGASAASAVSRPSRVSGRPSPRPTRSSRRAKNPAAARVTASVARK